MNPSERLIPARAISVLALIFVMCGGLAIGARLFHERSALQAELATLRSQQNPNAVANAAASDDGSGSVAADIERESALLRVAEAGAAEIGKSLPALSHEEWRSLGHVEDLGWQAGDLLRSMTETAARRKRGEKLSAEEGTRASVETTTGLARLAVIGELEDTPDEIARLHTAALSARLKLDAATADRVRQQIEREFIQLREQKLTRSHLPEAQADEWYERRSKALDEAVHRVEALIPASQRQEFVVGQSLHLGTGRRVILKWDSPKPGTTTMWISYDLPGLD